MDYEMIKEELHKVLIKKHFEYANKKKQLYAVSIEDIIKICIELIKVIEKVEKED